MIKYQSQNSQFNKNFIQKNYNLSYFNLTSYDLYNYWQSCTPDNMNNSVSDDGTFKVYYEQEQNTIQLWKAFNHYDDYEVDLGLFDYDSDKKVYFQFSEKKCIQGMKFFIINQKKHFKIKIQASHNKVSWNDIQTYNVGSQFDNNLDNSIFFVNKNQGEYLKGSFFVILKINNLQSYKFYRICFSHVNYYDLWEEDVGLKFNKMSLYDDLGVYSPLIKFPFNNNSFDYNNQMEGECVNINFNDNAAFFNNNSYIKFLPYFPYKIGNCSITFQLNLLNNSLSYGTIISKGYRTHRNDTGYVFNLSCQQYDFQNHPPLTFTALEDNSTICFYSKNSNVIGDIYYSDDNCITWKKYQFLFVNNENKLVLNLLKNQKVMFINLNNYLSPNSHFELTGSFNLSGDLISLTNYNKQIPYNEQFRGMFENNNSIIDASKLKLSHTSLSSQSYAYMFANCEELLKAPVLIDAIQKNDFAYDYMFKNCKKLNYIKVQFLSWERNYEWLSGVSDSGVFVKPSTLSLENNSNRIPNMWQVINIQDLQETEQNIDKIPNLIIFNFKSRFYDEKILISSSQVKNDFHHYAFSLGNQCDKFFIDGKEYFNYNYNVNQSNQIFNYGSVCPLTIGCIAKQNNNQSAFIMSQFISNMQFKNLTFYDFNLTEKDVRKQMFLN